MYACIENNFYNRQAKADKPSRRPQPCTNQTHKPEQIRTDLNQRKQAVWYKTIFITHHQISALWTSSSSPPPPPPSPSFPSSARAAASSSHPSTILLVNKLSCTSLNWTLCFNHPSSFSTTPRLFLFSANSVSNLSISCINVPCLSLTDSNLVSALSLSLCTTDRADLALVLRPWIMFSMVGGETLIL